MVTSGGRRRSFRFLLFDPEAAVEAFTCTIRGKETTMSDIDSKEFVLAGVVMKRLLSGEQTAGQFCLFENKSDGNTRTPIHVHAKDDETVYIIEGELTAVIGLRPSDAVVLGSKKSPDEQTNLSHLGVDVLAVRARAGVDVPADHYQSRDVTSRQWAGNGYP